MLTLGLSESALPSSVQRPALALRLRGRKGNAFVEFALCVLPMFALFFGISDIALAVFLKSMIQSAVRDGVRQGITYSTSVNGTNCGSQTNCMKQVVTSNTLGFLVGRQNLITVSYYAPTRLSAPLTAAECDPGGARTMPGDTQSPPRQLKWLNQPGNLLEVKIDNFPWSWMVPIPNFMPGSGILMSAVASDIMQGLPVGTDTPPTP